MMHCGRWDTLTVNLWALDILRSRYEASYISDILEWIELHVGTEGSIVFVGWEKVLALSLISCHAVVSHSCIIGEYTLLAWT